MLVEPGGVAAMLKVLFIHRDLPFHGGVPRFILNLARSCDPSRLRMEVGSFKPASKEMADAFGELGIHPVELGDRGYLGPTRRLRRHLRRERIDVVVANSFKSYLVSRLACMGLPCRVILWVHSIPLVIRGSIRRGLYRWLSRNDTLVFSSNAIKKVHLDPDHQGQSAVVYYGVEDPYVDESTRPYDRSMRQALGVPDDALVLCFIAEFIEWKDHATLLRAFELLDPKLNAHLLLVGTGELVDAMKARAAAMKAGSRVHFLSARPDARRLLGITDLYVHPSRGEGFGLAVVEAMLAGCTVITAREGAFIEYIDAGGNGAMFEAGNAQDLAQQIVELAQDRARAKQIGQQARAYALRMFSTRKFAEEACEVIESPAQVDEEKVA